MSFMKNLRRHRLIFLMVILFLAVCGVIPAGLPDVAFATLQQDSNGYYQLSSRADLFEMADMIQGSSINQADYGNTGGYSGNANPNANFKMTTDIDMTDSNGNASGQYWSVANTAFSGVFDGGGHTISNYSTHYGKYIQANTNMGFFPSTNGATIKNVTFDNGTISSYSGSYDGLGLVAGSMTDTTVTGVNITNSNILLDSNASQPGSNNTNDNIGILAGSVNGGSISNVNISGSTIEESSGTANNNRTINNVGVIAGSMNGTTLQNNNISGNQINLRETHKGNNVGTGTTAVGTSTNVTVINPQQPATSNQGSSGQGSSGSGTVTEEPTASPIPEEPSDKNEPEPTAEPSPTPLKQGDTFDQNGSTYKVLSGKSVGYVGNSDGEPVQEKEVIPDTVTENGVTYPVTRILENAFNGEKQLKEITFGRYIEVVENSAFKNCTSLKGFKSSPVLRIIDDDAFLSCQKLKEVNLPVTITKIGKRAFKNCKKMKTFILGDESLTIPEADKNIDVNEIRLSNFMKYETINISIGASVFENCQNLERVVINCEVTVIGNSAFSRCTKLSSIVVYSKKLKTVGNKALSGVHDCRISVFKVRLKKYKTLFKNRGQGKKVVIAKI